jgi:hypothetical protein
VLLTSILVERGPPFSDQFLGRFHQGDLAGSVYMYILLLH